MPFSFQFPESVTKFVTHNPEFTKASDGIDLAYYKFMPAQPKVVMIFYHGGGIWSNSLYQHFAQQLKNKHQIGTYLFDIRGHGNSQGERGDAPSKEQVWQDVSSAINFVAKNHPNTKLILGGHSSGAGMVLNYNSWHRHPAVDGFLFLSPFLGSRSGTTQEHANPENNFIKNVRLFPLLAHLLTGGYFFAHTPVIFFNYPESEKTKDRFILDHYTNTMTQATCPNDPKLLFENLKKPFVLLIGEKDEQFIPEKTIAFKEFATQVPGLHSFNEVGKSHSIAKIIPEARHLSILFDSIQTIGKEILKII